MKKKRGPGRPPKKRGPGRPRKKPQKDSDLLVVISELIDKKIEAAISQVGEHFKDIMVQLIKEHRERFHPMCDPKELDHVLRLLREEFERRKHGQF